MYLSKILKNILRDSPTPLSIEQFVQLALYHPDFGYYTTKVRQIGRRGDFSTSASLDEILGKAIALWALQRSSSFQFSHLNLIEVGAGSGQLALPILREIQRKNITFTYHIVEISPKLREQQRQLLASYPVSWHDDLPQLLEQLHGQALIFSNELVDAFPPLQLCWHHAQWQQVALTLEKDSLQEICIDLPHERFASFSSSLFDKKLSWPEKQRCELHLSYWEWLRSWLPLLKKGALLTIDYGDLLPELYYRRPRGTLRAYFQHLRFEGWEIYERFGQQDLTADVNFSDLIRWGELLGLVTSSFQNQRDFLLSWLPELASTSPHSTAAFLLDPQAAGAAFKVLEQQKLP